MRTLKHRAAVSPTRFSTTMVIPRRLAHQVISDPVDACGSTVAPEKPLGPYQPRVCSMCASSNPATAKPFIAPARSSLTSSNTFGS